MCSDVVASVRYSIHVHDFTHPSVVGDETLGRHRSIGLHSDKHLRGRVGYVSEF